jgi:CRP-like cAMP-binding protein
VTAISEKIENLQPTDAEIDEVIGYLKNLWGLKGRFEHLGRNQTRKLFSELECQFFNKGEYIFKQGETPDSAYVVLFGKVIFLDVKNSSYVIG